MERELRNAKRLEYINKTRAQCYEYLGGVCVKCGSTEELQFDHVDPSTKQFSISNKINRSFEGLKEELDKCQLLCKNCHKEKTISESQGERGWKHGTYYSFQTKKCRCIECLWAMERRNARRRQGNGFGVKGLHR